jgi:hypothetical protein
VHWPGGAPGSQPSVSSHPVWLPHSRSCSYTPPCAFSIAPLAFAMACTPRVPTGVSRWCHGGATVCLPTTSVTGLPRARRNLRQLLKSLASNGERKDHEQVMTHAAFPLSGPAVGDTPGPWAAKAAEVNIPSDSKQPAS